MFKKIFTLLMLFTVASPSFLILGAEVLSLQNDNSAMELDKLSSENSEDITNINQLPDSFSEPEGEIDTITNEEIILSTDVGEVSADLEDPIVTITEGNEVLTIETTNIEFSESEISDSENVVYESEEGISQENSMFEDGMQSVYVIHSKESEHIIRTEFLSSEEELSLLLDEEGFYKVVNLAGDTVFDIGYPWATDNAGNFIETSYELNGNTLTQIVSAQSEEAYPLTADPNICYPGSDTINNTKTSYTNPTLSVFPQPCARNYITSYWILGPGALSGFLASKMANDMWSEVLSEPSMQKNGAAYPYRERLKDQFICHAINPLTIYKTSWNLDTNRPDVSLWHTYFPTKGSICNPKY